MNKLSNKQALMATMALGAMHHGARKNSSAALDMLQAEARVWASYIRPLEDLTGERDTQDIANDPLFLAALDSIDFTALREFLDIVGNNLTRLVLSL